MIQAAGQTGRVGMTAETAEALAQFRRFNYDNVYLRPASQAAGPSGDLDCCRRWSSTTPLTRSCYPMSASVDAGSPDALHHAVAYVGGMTDRFACRQAVALLGWDTARLPQGIDTHL